MGEEDFVIYRPRKVCLCKSVTREQIVESIRRGNHTIELIAADTLATTGCGTCRHQVEKILEETLKQENLPKSQQ